jgi:photosystem II stability/assembly factor-like uncharacterized protein
MRLKTLLAIVSSYLLIILITINTEKDFKQTPSPEIQPQKKYNGPEEFLAFHAGIRTRDGEITPGYSPGYTIQELNKAKNAVANARVKSTSNGVIEWTERGPANVPGRTRGLVVIPADPSKNTWLAGSSGGGIWKTTNGGQTWINKSQDFPTMAVATLALCQNSPTVIYAGTGEYIASSGTAINGNGIFKSTDSGENWTQLSSTANNPDFVSITRVIVDPNNPNIVLACSAPNTWGSFSSTIMRSTDGGTTWTKVLNVTQGGAIEQLIATPGNFNVMYAAQRNVGVLKSIDAGQTWTVSNSGMSISGRLELDISPVNTNRIFASAQGSLSASNSDLYVSNDAGATWSLVNVSIGNTTYIDFLGGQGWYDNTILCDPFNADFVYYGGVGLFRTQLTGGSTVIPTFSAEEAGTTSFMELINFGGNLYGGKISASASATTSVYIKFGSNRNQKAHRFLVPDGATTGVPDASFSYQDYVTVPFEVWEVDNNGNDVRQLMVSFRDQDRNGIFNLLGFNDSGSATEQSREYVYVHNVTYSETQHANIAVNGGIAFNQLYFIWPVLASGASWNPANLPNSTFKIIYGSRQILNASTITVADVYGAFDGKNRFNVFGVDVHPDQHNMVAIPMSGSTYKILLSNDGGVFISNTSSTPGIVNGDWTMVGKTYNTSQFYGADKRPGFDEYFGGMQDNGTWKSPTGAVANASTDYQFNIGGDGFEVLWNSLDGNKLIGGSQGNGFRRSTNGGASWTSATSGLSGTHPFISKLANSKDNPDVIFTVSSAGVFRSNNFGENWTLTPITENWGASTFLDVEVSRANSNVVWAGSAMTSARRLHVSTDGGLSFTQTNNYGGSTLGSITRLASHPFQENTAYALFSFAKGPKVLRTTNLGQTWEDISGFGGGTTSTNGFPDVAVYCLYVRTDNPDIIWVGSEIGIIQSTDNGQSWALLTDFPNISVWDMKGQDNQVVLATHGRGIWTATLEAEQIVVKNPEVIAFGTTPKEKLIFRLNVEESFTKIEVYEGTTFIGTLNNISPSVIDVTIGNMTPGNKSLKFISYKGTAQFHSQPYQVQLLDLLEVKNSHSTHFGNINEFFLTGFQYQLMPDAVVGERNTLHTNHSYANNANYTALLRHPIRVSNATPSVAYEDIALVEPGVTNAPFGSPDFKDYVVIEATKNGLDWIPLKDGYDARYNATWLQYYTNATVPTKSMFVQHETSLASKFNVTDSVIVRFRLSSNGTGVGWGWAINYLALQQAPTKTENPALAKNNLQVYPNPSTGFFTVKFELTKPSEVRTQIIDVFGRVLNQPIAIPMQPGIHEQNFSLAEERNGIYFVVVKTMEGEKTERVVINK